MGMSELSVQTVGLEAHIAGTKGILYLSVGHSFQRKLSLEWMLTE